jgi:uncharacterized membrane protein
VNRSRVEAFSDGIFAIAITLLVLTIAQPSNYHDLANQLLDRWPSLIAYVVSFVVIGIMWLNHHAIFLLLDRLDRALVCLNLLLLMTVVFIPYPTGILGEALRNGAGEKVAAVAYSITMTLNAYAWTALWLYASSGRRLLNDAVPEAERGPATVRFTIGSVVYTLSIGVALINAYACLAFHGLLALYYAFDPLSRKQPAGERTEP